MKYELKKSRRRTLSISVKDAKVTVNAPIYASRKSIDAFVLSKKDWIDRHLESQTAQQKQKKMFDLDYGDDILFLGKSVKISAANTGEVRVNGESVIVPCDLEKHELKKRLKDFYRKEARRIITDKVEYFSGIMDVNPVNIRVTSARTRWGSCTSKGNVNFSWYVVMAPEAQIDYIVVHELAHLREMNHSARFWQIVERYVPDPKNSRKVLRGLHKRLLTENWDA